MRNQIQFANSRMLYNLLQIKSSDILIVKMIEDSSLDHLGIPMVDLSKIKHEVFTTKINYQDEKFVSKYLKDSDNDINNKITAHIKDPV